MTARPALTTAMIAARLGLVYATRYSFCMASRALQAQMRQKQSLLNIASGIGFCSWGQWPLAWAQTKRSWRSNWPISLPGSRVTMVRSRS
ncbi:hypothetical protein D3C80_1999270 [compost metagenome]